MGFSTIISHLRALGFLATDEESAADKEEQVEVFLSLFEHKTDKQLIAIIKCPITVAAAKEAARILISKRNKS